MIFIKKNKTVKKTNYFLIIISLLLLSIVFILDNYIVLFFNSLNGTILDSFFMFITNEYFVSFLIVIGFFMLWNTDLKYKYVFTIVVTYFISFLIKYLVLRPRPYETLNFIPLISQGSSSFPSMHTFFVFSALPFIYFTYPKYKYFVLSLVTLIAFSRIFVGVHYLSDVLFAAIFGFVIGYYIYKK